MNKHCKNVRSVKRDKRKITATVFSAAWSVDSIDSKATSYVQ